MIWCLKNVIWKSNFRPDPISTRDENPLETNYHLENVAEREGNAENHTYKSEGFSLISATHRGVVAIDQ